MEPWKYTLCDSLICLNERISAGDVDPETSTLKPEAVSKYKIAPEVDNETFTQFRCPRCGAIKTWGITRREVEKVLYERFANGVLRSVPGDA